MSNLRSRFFASSDACADFEPFLSMYEFDLPVSAYEPSHQRYDSTSSTASSVSIVSPSSSPLKSASGQQRVAYKNELSFTAPPLDRSSSLASLESVASSLIKTPPMENVALASPSLPPRSVQSSSEAVKRVQRSIVRHGNETIKQIAKPSAKLLVPPAAITVAGTNSESIGPSSIAASFIDRLWRRKGQATAPQVYRQPEYYEDDDIIAAVSSHHGVAY